MKTRMLKWFDVFVAMMFAIPDLLAIGVARWCIESNDKDATEFAKQTLEFTDEQINQVFSLIGMMIATAGMETKAAIEYAISAVRDGAGEPASLIRLREISTPTAMAGLHLRPIEIKITPATTFEEYITLIIEAGALPAYDLAPSYIKKQHERDFNHIKAHLYEDFEDFARDATPQEQVGIEWKETEVEDIGVPADYHGKGSGESLEGLLSGALGEVLGEALQELRHSRRGHIQ